MCSGLTDSGFANRDRNGILLLTNENNTKEEFLMKHSSWAYTDSQEAKQIWEEYQKQYNLSDRIGQQ